MWNRLPSSLKDFSSVKYFRKCNRLKQFLQATDILFTMYDSTLWSCLFVLFYVHCVPKKWRQNSNHYNYRQTNGQLLLRNCAVDFVEICNVCIGKMIIKAAKRIFSSDKICHSYSDLKFGVTFFGTQCIFAAWLISCEHVCLSVCLTVCPFVCLSVHLYFYWFCVVCSVTFYLLIIFHTYLGDQLRQTFSW